MALWLALAAPAAAQSVSDFQLPQRPQSDPRAQGPVDDSVPVITAPRPSASATPAPQPSASAPAAAAPDPAATQVAPRPAATARPQPQTSPASRTLIPALAPATPVASPSSAAAGPVATLPGLPALPAPQASGAPLPGAAQPGFGSLVPETESEASIAWWPWAAALGTLAVLLGLLAAWRRRRESAVPAIAFEPPRVPAPSTPRTVAPPASSTKPIAPSPAVPAPTATPTPTPAPALAASAAATAQRPIVLELVATRLSASLMAATLSYKLRVTNRSQVPFDSLAVEGDMIAAHAALPPERQILQSGQRLELRHALAQLAPGQSTELQGELRLPLSAITPIRAGEAALFIPLARFRLQAGRAQGPAIELRETFVVGELPGVEGGALRPFRLDLGPRTYSRVGQRAVA